MRLRHISALLAAGAASVAIVAAPAAAAAPTCTYLGSQTTQCESPGNVQITSDQPVTYPFPYPFLGDGLLFHHGGNHR